ncbi:MAG: PD-(D/E)XK nuclease family protein [Bacteroidota bacterium]
MILYFGLELDDLVFPQHPNTRGGHHHLGPQQLLYFLEAHLGLIGHPANNDHLRIEQYRQALQWFLQGEPTAFFARSFAADQLATATTLLAMRDELLLAAWDFQVQADLPERLRVLATIEGCFHPPADPTENAFYLPLSAGYADRFCTVLEQLRAGATIALDQIYLNEPFDLLPSPHRALFRHFEAQGIPVDPLPEPAVPSLENDLQAFQSVLLRRPSTTPSPSLRGDGSLLLLVAKRETEAATFLARFLRHNPRFRPVCLIPEKNRALDDALIQDGLPSLGILSASLARPSLQILKLISTFLWKPIDPYKMLEFVTLAVKPLDDELGRRIASQIAATPGIQGEGWRNMLRIYFEELEEKAVQDRSINPAAIRAQYEFWFERPRFPASGTVPRTEVIQLFAELQRWAYAVYEDSNGREKSLLVLSEQARRITDLLEALPEKDSQLSHLELERIVRTIYEPSPVLFKERQVGHLPHLHHNSAIIADTDDLLWWNFCRNEPDYFFSRWYQSEYHYLTKRGLSLRRPDDDNALLLWQRPRPVLRCRRRLLLVLPERVNGSEVYPHPLHDELEACFGDLTPITYRIDEEASRTAFAAHFRLPERIALEARQLGRPRAFLHCGEPEQLVENERETYTSLDALFYYPYQWVFRRKARWRRSTILSIVSDVALKGNLAHRLFEWLLKEEDLGTWDRLRTEAWIQQRALSLLGREGAVLLMYGREPDRVSFIRRMQQSAWTLLSMLQNNAWEVLGTEVDLSGEFMGLEVKGKADVVLGRGAERAVLDLKWRGAKRRENLIRNEADLQLVMYSRLLEPREQWAHTAYFIIEDGVMVARNQLAFREARAVSVDSDHLAINERIWAKMQATFRWRLAQLGEGKIEVRSEATLTDIELDYQEENWQELLEFPTRDAPFDDYRSLINLLD